MKKTTMMRIASTLLIAVLLTTCAIGATMAKYTTTNTVGDDARVAKWGVGITVDGHLFAEQYEDLEVEATDDSITVQVADAASVDQNVVAPGTKNDTGITFTLTGAPEVDVNVNVAVETSDIALPYGDDQTYYPVVFTLKNGAGNVLITGTLAQIEAWLENLSGHYETNTNLATIGTGTDSTTKTDGTYNLTWVWDFDASGAGTNDVNDTTLGNIAAGTATVANAVTEVSFNIVITVTQVDQQPAVQGT